LLIGVIAYSYFQSAGQSIRKQELLDLAYMEGYELDPQRAERAVRAGHGDLLEKRIRAGKLADRSS
jgi:ribosomal protein L12E/L44/L45/RPP1/RPP2